MSSGLVRQRRAFSAADRKRSRHVRRNLLAQAKGEEVVEQEEEESRGAQRLKKKTEEKERKEMWVIFKAGKQGPQLLAERSPVHRRRAEP